MSVIMPMTPAFRKTDASNYQKLEINKRHFPMALLEGFLAISILFCFPACTPGAEETDVPAYAEALLSAYPDHLSHYRDGREKSFPERPDHTDVEDMFQDVYRTGELQTPDYLSDPGRYRCEAFFKRIYGSSRKKVRRRLVSVDWFGQKIPFTKVNHAADSLKAVEREIKSCYPHFEKYFENSSSFNWRPVRGADRMSAHSYGMTIDICVDSSDYWRWDDRGKEELDEIAYHNRIPEEIIHVFERHGFISGARWYHYDTMHFEFRPELLIFAQLR